ncbi:response regulator transcription factor [Pontibacillus salicampi]|uniref:Response regulator transcription factor n=1 Tax=Pontibacillus salicampi TaxID=1449801 RepID=A0ABV6LMF9_9BACI
MSKPILLIEDDQEIARIIRDHLSREGFTVTWASTGKEGWEDFREQSYHLVIVDLMLPEMDGITVLKNIRLQSDVPIMIVSARQEDEQKIQGLKLGADDYVTKPFSLNELTARVESQLRRYHQFHQPISNDANQHFSDGLQVNLKARIVQVQASEVYLTSKEFELLRLLSTYPYRTFSKIELYEHVWGQPDVSDNNTIHVHMKGLRTKLKDSVKSPKWIETVWGTGYRFIGEKLS